MTQPKAPEQGSDKELTPMGQAISHFNNLSERVVLSHKQVAYILGQFLEAERKMGIDCYEQGYGDGYRVNGRTGSNFFTTKYRQQ